MRTEVDAPTGAGWGEVSPERTNHRNGYRPRPFDTWVGTIDLAIRSDRRLHHAPGPGHPGDLVMAVTDSLHRARKDQGLGQDALLGCRSPKLQEDHCHAPRERHVPQHDSRRDFLRKAGVVGAGATAAAWAAPTVMSVDAAAAATQQCRTPTLTGAITLRTLSAGDDVRPAGVGGNVNSNTTSFIMLEQSFLRVTTAWTPDAGATLNVDDVICVWLFHHSPSSGSTTDTGTITFPAGSIIGYDYRDTPPASGGVRTSLDQTDAFFVKAGVTYPTGDLSRRTMDGETGDSITAVPAGPSPWTTLNVTSFTLTGYVDQIRIYVRPT